MDFLLVVSINTKKYHEDIFVTNPPMFKGIGHTEHKDTEFLLSSQERYLCSQRIMLSPVILHINTLRRSKYCLKYI